MKTRANPQRVATPVELERSDLMAAMNGDDRACRALVLRYQRPVFALLSRMLASAGRQSQVEDLAQETFLRVFRSLNCFDPDGSARLSTWILTIATRLALDELRRRREIPIEGSVIPMPARSRETSGVDRRALGRAIERAVSELAPDFRAVFVLREYHGLSYDEIGHTLDCNVGTVRSRLSRARAALRDALTKEGYHE